MAERFLSSSRALALKVGFAAVLTVHALPAFAQGVPVFDPGVFAKREAALEQGEADLARQRAQLSKADRLNALEAEQLDALNFVHSTTVTGGSDIAAMIDDLEAGGEAGDYDGGGRGADADELYGANDPNPGAARLFGDANGNVEELIIKAAKETHGLAGVGKAGLSLVQWRCLMQALIWQESRFSIGAKSPVGAFGLTQIMPATASDLGINPQYYDSPYLQVTGGARYLAQMLAMFDGNIVHGLAAYNAGPGNVQAYGGVPPFAETRHYVEVIPRRYNQYLAKVGGIDALGTIEPSLLANSNLSLSADGARFYGAESRTTIEGAVERIRSIITQVGETETLKESYDLNTYARTELARLVALRTRLKAARTKPLSADEIAMASRMARERAFMSFELQEIN
ncbi:lytic transglycosylase domain-containing protein [Fulvimarina sp. 2208YS6-2-32]|uniref:Lytic transglycosylase domain-containing protein n=1 Tax=Fulvimarina uroteuthidis TaxID=3098149 RepID=A0ABU5I9I9_9HYPH|nr:lytic transglycosylase domain-containing protein [Fulvimarina sp. 2208YS6-2-32]MDY8110931.1 lytic transglycosylase domain-containing protein [Fulvimarina sp. 2208YS6-2-32]